ncbi:MAG TPA: carbohydrate kinase [Candidatus Angelobacter sp.]|nr:carbohydrate kinase [Candidatus Angelobacter sp.]
MKIAAIGEVLWDILPSAEHLGGAPFNFALHARNLGHDVSFISAVGNDEHGRRALDLMEQAGLSTRFVHRTSDHPTGTVTVSFDPSGPQYRIHRPAAYDFPTLSPAELDALLAPPPAWIYFGTLQQMSVPARDLTGRLLHAAPEARRFYDVNLRAGSFTPDLVRTLIQQAHALKLNQEELPLVKAMCGIEGASLEQFCREVAGSFRLESVCVTRAAEGCVLLLEGEYVEAGGFPIQVADAIGAGDAFSAALVHGISSGWPAHQAAEFANRVGALVASRPGGSPRWTVTEAMAL